MLRQVDPMARRGLLYRLFARLSGTRAMGQVSRLVAWRIDPFLLRLTGGRAGFSLLLPSALLETTGAKSGLRRANGVIYFHDGGDPIVIASKLGLPHHPAWFHNLRKNPQVRLGGQAFHPRSSPTQRSASACGPWPIASSRPSRTIAPAPQQPAGRFRSSG
jgi:deazaflavin-dependent oxidoreductase (nitroreductase family)